MNKKIFKAASVIAFAAVLAVCFAACSDNTKKTDTGKNSNNATVQSITATVGEDNTADVTIEQTAEKLSADGILAALGDFTVKASLSDGTEKTLTAADFTVDTSLVDTSATGSYLVTVAYGDFSTQITVTVREHTKTVESIALSTNSTQKTEFKNGDIFSCDGLKITVSYDDGTTDVLSDGFDVDSSAYGKNEDTSKDSEYTITVKYDGKECSYKVTVAKAAVISGISLNSEDVKTSFAYGENFSCDGLTVTPSYDDGTNGEPLNAQTAAGVNVDSSKYTASHGDESEGGQTYVITVMYRDFSATYNVNVGRAPAHIVGASIKNGTTPQPADFSYGTDFVCTDIFITLAMSYGDAKEADITDNNVSFVSAEYVAEHKCENSRSYNIEVYYKTFCAGSYEVTVDGRPAATYTLEISGQKTEFANGEDFSYGGITVTAVSCYGDRTVLGSDEYTVAAADYEKDNASDSEVKTYAASVAANNDAYGTAEYNVYVLPTATVISAEIDKSSEKISFDCGATATKADFSGVRLLVHWSYGSDTTVYGDDDGISYDLESLNHSLAAPNSAVEKYVDGELDSSAFTDFGITVTGTFDGAYFYIICTRKAKTAVPVGLLLDETCAYRTFYNVGESIDSDNLTVLVCYDNAAVTPIPVTSGYTVVPDAAYYAGEKFTQASQSYISVKINYTYENVNLSCGYGVMVAPEGYNIVSIGNFIPNKTNYDPYFSELSHYGTFNLNLANDTDQTYVITGNLCDRNITFAGFGNKGAGSINVSVTYNNQVSNTYTANIVDTTFEFSAKGTVTEEYFLGQDFVTPTGTFFINSASNNSYAVDAGELTFDSSLFDKNTAGTYEISYSYQIQKDDGHGNITPYSVVTGNYEVTVHEKSALEIADYYDIFGIDGYNVNETTETIGGNETTVYQVLKTSGDKFTVTPCFNLDSSVENDPDIVSFYAGVKSFAFSTGSAFDGNSLIAPTYENGSQFIVTAGDTDAYYTLRITVLDAYKDFVFHILISGQFFDTLKIDGEDITVPVDSDVSLTYASGKTEEIIEYSVKSPFRVVIANSENENDVNSGDSIAVSDKILSLYISVYFANADDKAASIFYFQIYFEPSILLENAKVNGVACRIGGEHYFSVTVDGANSYEFTADAADGYTYTATDEFGRNISDAKLFVGVSNHFIVAVAKDGKTVVEYTLYITVKIPFNFNVIVNGDYNITTNYDSDPTVLIRYPQNVSVSLEYADGSPVNWANGGKIALADGGNIIIAVLESEGIKYYSSFDLNKNAANEPDDEFYYNALPFLNVTIRGIKAEASKSFAGTVRSSVLFAVLPQSQTPFTSSDFECLNDNPYSTLTNVTVSDVKYANGRFAVKINYTQDDTEKTGRFYVYTIYSGTENGNTGFNLTVGGTAVVFDENGEASISAEADSKIAYSFDNASETLCYEKSIPANITYTSDGETYLGGTAGTTVYLYYTVRASDGKTYKVYKLTVELK
jgi:hypothetical protein